MVYGVESYFHVHKYPCSEFAFPAAIFRNNILGVFLVKLKGERERSETGFIRFTYNSEHQEKKNEDPFTLHFNFTQSILSFTSLYICTYLCTYFTYTSLNFKD